MTMGIRMWPLSCCFVFACANAGPRSPEQLRQAYAKTLAANDPDRAYELLAPEVQAQVSREDFRARWVAQAKERKAALADLNRLPPDRGLPLRQATTAHSNGATLRWVDVDGQYRVVSGLPGLPNTETPANAIRAFLSAVRAADWAQMRSVLSDDLARRLREDWLQRVDAIERALEQPGSLKLSRDTKRAELRYDRGRSILLEQSPAGWRIVALE